MSNSYHMRFPGPAATLKLGIFETVSLSQFVKLETNAYTITTMLHSLTSIAFVLMTWMPSSVDAHGSLLLPRSRNEVARQEGTNGEQSGVPVKEYCWQCLNRNNGVCGYVDEKDYDAWVDSTGKPMPWKPQATYQRGQVITVSTGVWAYHWGHIELRACPNGRQSTQVCLDSYPLEFVEDVDYDMPKDPQYPDRGYLAERYETYTMKFRLPNNLVGDQVLLQVSSSYSESSPVLVSVGFLTHRIDLSR